MATSILWFRRDLRLADNPALTAALERGSVIPVFIHAPEEEAPWEPGAASHWWLHHSLAALGEDLRGIGSLLQIFRGDALEILPSLVEQTGADAVFWNRLYEPAIIARDRTLKSTLRERGVDAQSYNAALLVEPWIVANKQDKPFRVFTPYWRNVSARLEQTGFNLQARPKKMPLEKSPATGVDLAELGLLPSLNWDAAFYDQWQPGEQGALAALDAFIDESLADYLEDRDRPDLSATSKLSPHLHFGEIGPRQIWQVIHNLPPAQTDSAVNSRKQFLAEVGWREFAHHLLFHFPHTTTQPLNEKYAEFPWRDPEADASAAADLRRWQRGETGVALVDAGMRELWQTGIMHNRVRMIVASFLTKNLRIHWLHGARWFWETLVDADLAANTLGWQWTAGCGADAAPYFRVFNPDTQAKKFDPDAVYRDRWLPATWRNHEPMVDLKISRVEALDAWQTIR